MDRPSGAYIQDPKTGAITPDLSDEAMKARQPAAEQDQPEEPKEQEKPDKRQRR
jgi:hypothetical protein